jgi:alkylation response protein AidB-like acyl-CoA dehydrogenase
MSPQGITPDELRDAVSALLQAEGDLSVVRLEPPRRGQALDELWEKVAGLGCLGVAIAERYGGLGLGFVELGALYEELGRHLTPLPVTTTLLAADAIAIGGNEEQRDRWLTAIAAGDLRASLALPKPLQPLPRLEKGGAVVGNFSDVLDADRVDEMLVPVADEHGLMLAILSRSDPALEVVPCAGFDLTRTLCEVHLKGVEIGRERLIRLDEPLWRDLLDHASLGLACDAVGGAARILEDTVSYLGTRRQFDRPLGSFQALKHRAASWKVLLEGARALSRHAAELLAGRDAARSAIASCAKVSGCETYVGIAGDAVQLHGGIGFTWEHECHLFLKRARLDAVLFGSVIQHKERAAQFAFADALGAPDPARRVLLSSSEPAAGAGASTCR